MNFSLHSFNDSLRNKSKEYGDIDNLLRETNREITSFTEKKVRS